MNPHLRQILLQWVAITSAPHISQRGSRVERGGRPRPSVFSRRSPLVRGKGGSAIPSFFASIGTSDQKKSDNQPMRRPVTLPKVPVAAGRAT